MPVGLIGAQEDLGNLYELVASDFLRLKQGYFLRNILAWAVALEAEVRIQLSPQLLGEVATMRIVACNAAALLIRAMFHFFFCFVVAGETELIFRGG